MENNSETIYYINMYIRQGDFHASRARSSAMQNYFSNAKNEYLIAIESYKMAEGLAKEFNEWGYISQAKTQISLCKAEIARIDEKQR